MAPVLFADLGQYVLGLLLFVSSLFLVLLILVQRGRGGGLTGALGGVGGQSAFGTKAGDLFTKITVAVAILWILLCMLTIITLNGQAGFRESDRSQAGATRPANEMGATPDPKGGEAAGDAAAGGGADESAPAGTEATQPAGEAPAADSTPAEPAPESPAP